MRYRKLTAGAVALSVAAIAAGAVATAGAVTSAPSKISVKESYGLKMVPNHYIQDMMRFNKDVYTIKSGGTLKFIMTQPQEGPHSFTVVAKKDLPRTAKQAFNCKICNTLAKAHGADPNSNAPPKFQFLENGVGQNTPPNIDRAGDSALVFPVKGSSVSLKVTAKRGTVLHFMCLIHPWMQATLNVQ
jgi:uncharacterized cupredoxin-like copper-binding protein